MRLWEFFAPGYVRGQQKGPLAVCASAGLWNPGVSLATSPHRTLPPTRAAHGDGGALDAATKRSSVIKLPAGRGFVNAGAAARELRYGLGRWAMMSSRICS